jgi:hypothetical protein
MGYVISYAESMFNATGVLAGLIVLMIAVTCIDLTLKKIRQRFSYWKPIRRIAAPGTDEPLMRTRRTVAVVALLSMLAAAAPPAARAAEKVTVGIGGVGPHGLSPRPALAKAKGFFEEEGLDVEILDIKGGGAQAASALIGGSVDFSANAIDHAIKAKVQKKGPGGRPLPRAAWP